MAQRVGLVCRQLESPGGTIDAACRAIASPIFRDSNEAGLAYTFTVLSRADGVLPLKRAVRALPAPSLAPTFDPPPSSSTPLCLPLLVRICIMGCGARVNESCSFFKAADACRGPADARPFPADTFGSTDCSATTLDSPGNSNCVSGNFVSKEMFSGSFNCWGRFSGGFNSCRCSYGLSSGEKRFGS